MPTYCKLSCRPLETLEIIDAVGCKFPFNFPGVLILAGEAEK
jgi:hypothetical protein